MTATKVFPARSAQTIILNETFVSTTVESNGEILWQPRDGLLLYDITSLVVFMIGIWLCPISFSSSKFNKVCRYSSFACVHPVKCLLVRPPVRSPSSPPWFPTRKQALAGSCHATFNIQHSTFNIQHSTFSPRFLRSTALDEVPKRQRKREKVLVILIVIVTCFLILAYLSLFLFPFLSLSFKLNIQHSTFIIQHSTFNPRFLRLALKSSSSPQV